MDFLNKLRAVTLGTMHDLLDKTVDMNSPSVLRQYVRDLEVAIDKMRSDAAVQDGQLRTMKREATELEGSIATDKAVSAKLLASSDPTAPQLAENKAKVVLQNQQRLTALQGDIVTQANVSSNMQSAVAALDGKHALIMTRLRELERLDRDSKTKEQAADAIAQAGKLVSAVGSDSVDDLTDRMRRRHDVADARFDSAVGSLHTDEAATSDDVAALLASLKPVPVAV